MGLVRAAHSKVVTGGEAATKQEEEKKEKKQEYEEAAAARRLGGDGGVQVSYTLSVQGGATAVLRELRKTSFASTLATEMVAAGVAGVSGSDVSVTSRVAISNDQLGAPAGLSLNQLLVLLSAFVLGVLLTTVRAAQLRAKERRASGGQ